METNVKHWMTTIIYPMHCNNHDLVVHHICKGANH